MTTVNLIGGLGRLPLTDKFFVMEQTLKSNRTEKEKTLKTAVDTLFFDYSEDKELTVFTKIDNEPFF